jgi:predicted phosphodiesterase
MRIFAISDLHVDFQENRQWVDRVSDIDYRNDVLLIAGDVSHQLDRLKAVFDTLNQKFAHLYFVPGNHDLWVRNEAALNSIDKFHQVMELCDACEVLTKPRMMGLVWIVPLFSWYRLPGLGADSLYAHKKGEDPSLRMWSDNRFTRWPMEADGIVDYFLNLNKSYLPQVEKALSVITFSHFLPRQELIFSTSTERQQVRPGARDPHPGFNFSRVAGTSLLDEQVREFGAHVHIYGHQHRNRDRHLNGIRYVSHCLGYRRERARHLVCSLVEGPKQVWPGDS